MKRASLPRPEASRGEHLVEILIAIARSEYPDEWSQFRDLTQKLGQEINEQALEFSVEDCARRWLTGHDRNVHGLIADFYSQMAGAAPSQLQEMTWEASRLEQLFRDRLISLIHSGAYSLTGFGPDLHLVSIPSELISAKLIRFDRDEIKLGDTIIRGVRAAPTTPRTLGPQAPGPKPGDQTAKPRAHDEVRAILSNDAKRPLRGHGRIAKLARMVREKFALEGIHYELNSIEKMIRPAAKEWEERNPER
jgi:hypothetical protein